MPPHRASPAPLIAGIIAVLITTACGAPPAQPLEPADFVPAGVPVDSDSVEIRLSFGEPDSVSMDDNVFDSELPLATWHYPGFEVRFGTGAVPTGYLLTDSTERTMRGLRVGDPASRALELYGRPAISAAPSWTWIDDTDESGLRVVDVVVAAGSVSRIYLGRAVN